MKSIKYICNLIGNIIWKRKFNVRCVTINEDAIKGEYVTTNDIITSKTMILG